MVYDFYLFQGHGEPDAGACANGYKELDIAYEVAEGVYNLLKNTFKIHRNTKQQNNYTNNFYNQTKKRIKRKLLGRY